MYKQAAQLKLRFLTSKGSLSVEQLWDLSQTELSNCIRRMKKVLKKNDDDDLAFLDDVDKTNPEEQLAFDILKDVFITKKADAEALRTAREDKEHNQKIIALIKEKQEGALKDKTVEELEAMLK